MYKSRIRNAKERNGRNEKSREMEEPSDGQEYAIVERLLGNGRVEVYCEDGTLKVVRIRGSMRKFKAKVIIENGDLVIIAPWDFEPSKGDLIYKYKHEEVARLLYEKDLPEKILKKLNKNAGGDYGLGNIDESDDEVVFANETVRATDDDEDEDEKTRGIVARKSVSDDDIDIDAI